MCVRFANISGFVCIERDAEILALGGSLCLFQFVWKQVNFNELEHLKNAWKKSLQSETLCEENHPTLSCVLILTMQNKNELKMKGPRRKKLKGLRER